MFQTETQYLKYESFGHNQLATAIEPILSTRRQTEKIESARARKTTQSNTFLDRLSVDVNKTHGELILFQVDVKCKK